MSYKRTDRISEEIKKEITGIIRGEVKDPRISPMFSVVRTEVTRDLRHAKVYISVLGSEEERTHTVEGLKRAAGYIRKELGTRLGIRYIPELHFVPDSSIEYSIEIAKKLEQIRQASENSTNPSSEDFTHD